MRRHVEVAAAVLLAVAHLGALVAPAAILAVTADKGGLADLGGYDLLVASSVIGLLHAGVVAGRLRRARRRVGLTSALLAGFDGLFVVAVVASGLLFVLLGAQGPVGAVLINEGVPILVLWVAVQVVAVLLGEAVQRGVARWLAGAPDAPDAAAAAHVDTAAADARGRARRG